MSIAAEPHREVRIVTETARRRWRLAALLGLAALLTLTGLVVVQAEQSARSNRTVPVLKATRDIRAGAPITAGDLGIAYVRVDDPSVLASLVNAGERSELVGQVATDGVRAGGLIPAGLGAPEATAGLWEVPVPVKAVPPDLRAGDHVAVLVSGTGRSGEPAELVAAQDVRVLAVQQGSVDLWLPAGAAAQVEFYASHGEVVLARMPPGAVQRNLAPAGGS